MQRLHKRWIAVATALLLFPLGFATLLVLPADSTTQPGRVPNTAFTAHVVGHVWWSLVFAGVAFVFFTTRKPRTLGQAWREDSGASIAFTGLVLLSLAQLVEAAAATTLGTSTDDATHDQGIMFAVGPAEAILLVGLVTWGIQTLVRRMRNRSGTGTATN